MPRHGARRALPDGLEPTAVYVMRQEEIQPNDLLRQLYQGRNIGVNLAGGHGRRPADPTNFGPDSAFSLHDWPIKAPLV